MEFEATRLSGAFLVKPKKISDERGFFARAWCAQEMQNHHLKAEIRQSNMAVTERRGTLRGLHFQASPHQEAKFLRCVRGAIFDVIVDLRTDSPTYKQWQGFELNTGNHFAIYVPEGFATGYMTLADDTEIYYHTSAAFAPEFAYGVRYDDPSFGIAWPMKPVLVSEQDASWPYL